MEYGLEEGGGWYTAAILYVSMTALPFAKLHITPASSEVAVVASELTTRDSWLRRVLYSLRALSQINAHSCIWLFQSGREQAAMTRFKGEMMWSWWVCACNGIVIVVSPDDRPARP